MHRVTVAQVIPHFVVLFDPVLLVAFTNETLFQLLIIFRAHLCFQHLNQGLLTIIWWLLPFFPCRDFRYLIWISQEQISHTTAVQQHQRHKFIVDLRLRSKLIKWIESCHVQDNLNLLFKKYKPLSMTQLLHIVINNIITNPCLNQQCKHHQVRRIIINLISTIHHSIFELKTFRIHYFQANFCPILIFKHVLSTMNHIIIVSLIQRNKPQFLFINHHKDFLSNQFNFGFNVRFFTPFNFIFINKVDEILFLLFVGDLEVLFKSQEFWIDQLN